MKRKLLLCLALIISLSLSACSKKTDDVSDDSPTPNESINDPKVGSKAEELLKNMSLEEKIGQLFIIRPDALDSSLSTKQINDTNKYGVQSVNSRMLETLKQYPVGGIVMFGKNISTPDHLKTYISKLQNASQIGLFMGIDEEGGIVSRIANNKNFATKKYKNMTEIGNTKDINNAKDVGVTIGTYLKEYGFNLDFAPDADVNTNPKNPIIGTRSFGSDAQLVGNMVSACVEGFHSVNIMTSIKHFPGHGDTQTDTHLGYASTNKTWEEMLKCEIIPFQKGIEALTDMVMVSHITAIHVTDDNLPSSLSYEMITNKLRGELKYDGIVITDSLSMEAITNQYNTKDAAIKALNAGVDILLMPQDYRAAFNGLVEAVKDGTMNESRIDESVLKILTLKNNYNLIK